MIYISIGVGKSRSRRETVLEDKMRIYFSTVVYASLDSVDFAIRSVS